MRCSKPDDGVWENSTSALSALTASRRGQGQHSTCQHRWFLVADWLFIGRIWDASVVIRIKDWWKHEVVIVRWLQLLEWQCVQDRTLSVRSEKDAQVDTVYGCKVASEFLRAMIFILCIANLYWMAVNLKQGETGW